MGRNEVGEAARLERNGSKKLSLDHIVKERYPTFVDALRDLDDALSLLFLFAGLPSTTNISPKTIALCQRLCLEFQHYLIVTHSLRKSFLSIKGIYYQATIQGQDILWLVPYKFVQRVTGDIDFRIMSTFVEFYTTLLGFVNYRLYTSVGLVYPPKFNAKSDERGGELDALILEGQGIEPVDISHSIEVEQSCEMDGSTIPVDDSLQAKVDQIDIGEENAGDVSVERNPSETEANLDSDTVDKFENIAAGGDVLLQPQASNAEASRLFASCTFFLSREAPRQPLELLLRAFGCKRIGWNEVLGEGAYTTNESDITITHQIVDRPLQPISSVLGTILPMSDEAKSQPQRLPPGYRIPGRIYIQPQHQRRSPSANRSLCTRRHTTTTPESMG